ncbi:DUF2238 domain-containing protein [Candidatus Woesearchaeota archaeon]|jgi:uncharacterized membrane protein YjdF|nr:MAG: DUF2238 domain-containing protein [Candidatus Woesearchaeota archaeon]
MDEKYHKPVLLAVLALIVFASTFILQKNYEFIIYIFVVLSFLWLICHSTKYLDYSELSIWGLVLWAILHMAGGGVHVKGDVLYNLILIPLVGEPFWILKFDQVVHLIGFFVATLVMYDVLKPHVKKMQGFALGFTLFAAGLGLGALNEIVEFFATVILPSTNVGGYYNTALDLVFNGIGALAAVLYRFKFKK